MNTQPWTLVTGASGGIGFELAAQAAQRGYNIVLVARKPEELQKAATQLESSYKCKTLVIAKDIAIVKSSQEIYDFCNQQGIIVEILINNAGFGKYGIFTKADVIPQLGMIDLNIRALTELSRLFLPDMVRNKRGYILNVASSAGFQPGPLMAVYYATKAYVLSFSQALRNELLGSGVYVTALCPGATRTNFQGNDAIFENTKLNKYGIMLTAAEVARQGFMGLLKNKSVIIPGAVNKLLTFSTRLTPKNLLTAISRWTLEP
jgi:short-subunit dehydrogenase